MESGRNVPEEENKYLRRRNWSWQTGLINITERIYRAVCLEKTAKGGDAYKG